MRPFYYLDALSQSVAAMLGVDIVTTRLLMSVLFGYPISGIYSINSSKWTVRQRQLYLLLSGVLLFTWNFGFDIVHILIGITATMFVNYAFFRSKFAVIFAFLFNMGYLVTWSHIRNKNEYDINWTTPYCILCLRLIGLSWDLYDGGKSESARSRQQKKSALERFPEFIETFSFCFVPTAFLSGPQFSMRHYQAFINGSLRPEVILRNRTFLQRSVYNVKVQRTVIRLTLGLTGIMVLSNLLTQFPADTMLTREFLEDWSLLSRLVFMCIFSHIVLFRYIAIWLIGEGACVLLGLGCTGLVHVKLLDRTGLSGQPSQLGRGPTLPPSSTTPVAEVRSRSALERRDSAIEWVQVDSRVNSFGSQDNYDPSRMEIREAEHTACANISLGNLLLATNTDRLVAGFNINTNRWVLEYVYKRLQFLNHKTLSLLCSLTFLALWHGTYSGYFVCFALEFITISAEKGFLSVLKRSRYAEFFYHTGIGCALSFVIGRLHVCFLLITPMVVFYLLKVQSWYPVVKSIYFVGFVYLLWPLLQPVVKWLIPPVAPNASGSGVSRRLGAATDTSANQSNDEKSSRLKLGQQSILTNSDANKHCSMDVGSPTNSEVKKRQ